MPMYFIFFLLVMPIQLASFSSYATSFSPAKEAGKVCYLVSTTKEGLNTSKESLCVSTFEQMTEESYPGLMKFYRISLVDEKGSKLKEWQFDFSISGAQEPNPLDDPYGIDTIDTSYLNSGAGNLDYPIASDFEIKITFVYLDKPKIQGTVELGKSLYYFKIK